MFLSVKTAAVQTIAAKVGDIIFDSQTQLTYFVANDGVRVCLNDLLRGGDMRSEIEELRFKLDALLEADQKGKQYIEWLRSRAEARRK